MLSSGIFQAQNLFLSPASLSSPCYVSPVPFISAYPLQSVSSAFVQSTACLGVAMDAQGYLVILLCLGLECTWKSC